MPNEIKKSKIYTKKGDQGKTSLVDGTQVDKFHLRVEAYGAIDELNSSLGIVRAHLNNNTEESLFLEKIQNDLFRLGSLIACPDVNTQAQLPPLLPEHILNLEKKMDEWDSRLPALKNFILPAGSIVSSFLHLSRTICRRAERNISALQAQDEATARSLIYINRLSDLLFILARHCNKMQNINDVLWKKNT